jgi:hypothetical protein
MTIGVSIVVRGNFVVSRLCHCVTDLLCNDCDMLTTQYSNRYTAGLRVCVFIELMEMRVHLLPEQRKANGGQY